MGQFDGGAQPQWGPSTPPLDEQQHGQYYTQGTSDPALQQQQHGQYYTQGTSDPGLNQQQQYYGGGGGGGGGGGAPGGYYAQAPPAPGGPGGPGYTAGYPGQDPGAYAAPAQGKPAFAQQQYQQQQQFPQQQYQQQQFPQSPTAPVYAQQAPLPQVGRAFQVQAPVVVMQPQPWTTDLFGCFEDLPSCIITFLAPCVTYGQVIEIVDQGHSTCFTGGTIYALILWCFLVPCFLSYTARSRLRAKYGLPEDPMNDLCTHFWCESCALCQEYRELKNRGMDPALGWAGVCMQHQAVMAVPGQPAMVR